MSLHKFDRDWYFEVDLTWDPPVKVNDDFDALPDCTTDEHGVYRFERAHHLSSGPREIVRIGIAYDQTIAKRANQYLPYLPRYRRKGDLWFSHAVLDINGQHRRQRYEDVEHLLVFACQPCENTHKRESVPRDHFYRIRNYGHRGRLPRKLTFPAMDVSW